MPTTEPAIAVDGLPAPVGHSVGDVAALADLLGSMADFSDDYQRARYLLTCDWMRDKLAVSP